MRIKLRPKQIEAIKQVLNDKAHLDALMRQVEIRRLLVLGIVFEEHGVVNNTSDVHLDGEYLDFTSDDRSIDKVE